MPILPEKKHILQWLRKNLLAVLFCLLLGIISAASFYSTEKSYITHTAIDNQGSDNVNHFETDFSGSIFGKFTFLNVNGAMRKLLGQREMNGIVRLNNDYLALPTDPVDESTLAANAASLGNLNRALTERGIPLLYVATPFKVSPSNPELPIGVADSTNENTDVLLEHVRAEGVSCLDLREAFNQNNIDPYNYFYRTDHHWNTRGGFYAYTQLVPQLESMMDTKIDSTLTDLSNYTITTYPSWHLGSYGQRTGQFFAGVDDFELIEPNFDTKIDRYYGFDYDCSGSFRDVIINTSPLQKRDLTQRLTYDATLGTSLNHFFNENASSDKKILVIGDSMAKAVNPFLILSFREVYTIDGYNPDALSESLLAQYQPDIVMIMQYPTLMYDPDYFQYIIK